MIQPYNNCGAKDFTEAVVIVTEQHRLHGHIDGLPGTPTLHSSYCSQWVLTAIADDSLRKEPSIALTMLGITASSEKGTDFQCIRMVLIRNWC